MRDTPDSFEVESVLQTPHAQIKGVLNTSDGYEYLEYPAESGMWYVRNRSSGHWEQWSQ